MKANFLIPVLSTCLALTSASAEKYSVMSKGHGGGGDDKKMFVGVSVGAGIPLANYGKSDTLNSSDTTHLTGWAKTGFHFNVKAGYYFTNNVGAMIQIGGNMNSYNSDALAKAEGLTAPATVKATSNYIGSYLVGPCFKFPVSDKLTVEARALGGLMTAKLATVTEDIPSFIKNEISYTATKAFGYNVGLGLKYNVSDNIGITLGADYLGGTPVFKEIKVNSSGTFFGVPFNESVTSGGHKLAMSTGVLNTTLGLTFNF